MASDSTNIADLPGASDSAQTNRVVLEKTEIPGGDPPMGAMGSMPADLSSESINKIVMGIQQASATGMTQLPSKNIPMQTHPHMQDPQIQPNYVPPAAKEDFIEQHDTMHSLIQQNKNTQKEQDRLDILYSELQTPLLVMVLFFTFQMPFFQKKFMKIFPSLFLKDGHPTISGYVLKTIMFGGLFYAINKSSKYLSEI